MTGLFLVLSDAQIDRWDLVCALKSAFPNVRFYAQRLVPMIALEVGEEPVCVIGLAKRLYAQLEPQRRTAKPKRYVPRERGAWWQR